MRQTRKKRWSLKPSTMSAGYLSIVPVLSGFVLLSASCATSHAVNTKPSKVLEWDGKYRRTDGALDLYIEHFDETGIEVDVERSGAVKDAWNSKSGFEGSHFLAEIKGDVAVRLSPSGDSECKLELQRVKEGIRFSEDCGGANRESGLYTLIR